MFYSLTATGRTLVDAHLAAVGARPVSTLRELPTIAVNTPSRRDPAERDRLIRRAKALSCLSLAWMTVEGTVAIAAALTAGSVALLGFGIDSAIEGLAAVIVIWRFTGRRRLCEQAEQRSQKAVGVSFFLLAPFIAQDAIHALISGDRSSASSVGMGLSVSSIVAMPLLGHAKQRVGERLGSAATSGEGAQNLLCAYMAAGVLLGLAANAALGWWWLDPVIALMIAAVTVREGREAWAGKGCACVTVPGLQGPGCQDNCC